MKRRKVGLLEELEYEFAQMDPGMAMRTVKEKSEDMKGNLSSPVRFEVSKGLVTGWRAPSFTLSAQQMYHAHLIRNLPN